MKTRSIYLDTEFSEGFFKPISYLPSWIPGNKPRWSIELISIGLVDDEGKEYYAINRNFKESRCNDWVKENVLTKLPARLICDETSWWARYHGMDCEECGLVPNPLYKSVDEIRNDIINFVAPASAVYAHCESSSDQENCLENYLKENPIRFKGYFSEYDWICLATIFGDMGDLPAGFPMYCYDLKQKLDSYIDNFFLPESITYMQGTGTEVTFKLALEKFQGLHNYPKQDQEHNAIGDARWNKLLDEFIPTL